MKRAQRRNLEKTFTKLPKKANGEVGKRKDGRDGSGVNATHEAVSA